MISTQKPSTRHAFLRAIAGQGEGRLAGTIQSGAGVSPVRPRFHEQPAEFGTLLDRAPNGEHC